MTDRAKNILIGLFIVAALTVGIAMILFLEPQIGDGGKTIRVRFTNISGIVVGTRVTFAGKPVGEVVHIREIKEARTTPDELGRVYFYELSLKTDSSVEVYSTDEIAVRSTGLMGERSVAILPKAGLNANVITGEIIYANSTDPLENTFQQIAKVATKLEGTITCLDQWFQDNSSTISSTIQNLDHTLTYAGNILANLDEQQLFPAIRESADLFSDTLRAVHSSLTEDQLLHNFSSLIDKLDETARILLNEGGPMLAQLNQITKDINDGSGTLGRLIGQDGVYLHFNSLLGKAETMMNDINHYGVLFQYDKHWQRSRTKKANLLQALETPKEFRTYFEGEIDAITVSLGRLSELIERAENLEEKDRMSENQSFQKHFAALLLHAQSLTDSIKLYNEQLQSAPSD